MKKVLLNKIISEMTDDEKNIIRLHAKGLTAEEISEKLDRSISARTVENKTLELCKRFEVKNKTALCSLLIDNGGITLNKK